MPGTKDLEVAAEVRALTNAEMNKMTNKQLQTALKTLVKDPTTESQIRMENKLDQILNELQEQKEEREAMKGEIIKLRIENEALSEAVFQHQRYLESIEAEKRAANLIITGITEGDFLNNEQVIQSDEDKCAMILETIGMTHVELKHIERLGEAPEANSIYKRPVKVVLQDPKVKKLKTAGQQFAGIFIKKDVHPVVRKELNRLREVTRKEKEKPENEGKVVQYEHTTRKVTV